MQRLQRIDQHAGDVAPRAQHAQGILRHLLQRIGVASGDRIADARLHIAPPAVIGPAEAHQMRAARMILGEPHGLHDRLGARHVERDLVEAGDLRQARHVVGDHGMVGAEHGTEIAHALRALVHAGLVEVVAEQVDAVRAGQVVEAVAVEVGQRDARRRLPERSGAQVLAHQAAELERHPVGGGELQVGDAVLDLGRQLAGFAEMLLVQPGQAYEPLAPAGGDLVGRIVDTEEVGLVELVERNERGKPARHARVAGQRAVLGLRQLQAPPDLGQRGTKGHCAEPVERVCGVELIHSPPTYATRRDAA